MAKSKKSTKRPSKKAQAARRKNKIRVSAFAFVFAVISGVFLYVSFASVSPQQRVISNAPVVGIEVTPSGKGYWAASNNGGVFTFGDSNFNGSLGNVRLNQRIVAIERASSNGYWLLGEDGGVFSFGSANFYGSLPGLGVNTSSVVGMAASPTGKGYWIALQNGRVYNFGDAKDVNDLPRQYPNVPINNIVAIDAAPGKQGFRLLGADGGVFDFGVPGIANGSLPAIGVRPNGSAVDIVITKSGNGHWVFSSRGQVYAFGDAKYFKDSARRVDLRSVSLNGAIVDATATADYNGYYMIGSDGGVFTFGNAQFYGASVYTPPTPAPAPPPPPAPAPTPTPTPNPSPGDDDSESDDKNDEDELNRGPNADLPINRWENIQQREKDAQQIIQDEINKAQDEVQLENETKRLQQVNPTENDDKLRQTARNNIVAQQRALQKRQAQIRQQRELREYWQTVRSSIKEDVSSVVLRPAADIGTISIWGNNLLSQPINSSREQNAFSR